MEEAEREDEEERCSLTHEKIGPSLISQEVETGTPVALVTKRVVWLVFARTLTATNCKCLSISGLHI